MLLTVRSLNLAYGPRVLFKDASMLVQPRARMGLVGPNGSGKTTLLKIINGLEEADKVDIEKRNDVSFGYLPQEGIVLGERNILDEVEAAASDIQALQEHLRAVEREMESLSHDSDEYAELLDSYTHINTRLADLEAHKLRSRAESILFGLGFRKQDLSRPCREFSGGWQMRVALARLLLEEPDLLMMDEPTNHLDLDSLRWMETFLKNYPGAVLLISHDRALLDQLCNSIVSIEMGGIIAYTGNYSAFLRQQEQRREQLETARRSQERKIAHTERFIERFRYKDSKARQVQSRIKALEKIERIETESAEKTVQFAFPLSRKGGHTVIEVSGLHKAYGPVRVFSGFSLKLERGDRVGVVGINGAGKSTLARILAEREPADAGSVNPGYQVDTGYFAQDQGVELNPDSTVFQIASASPVRATDTHIRSILGSFLFSGDDVDKPVKVLSGGEKNRLALARLLLCPANFLILDEPTNHLDMASKAVLQEALLAFPGTTFVVSHDRHFLNPVVNKILEIRPGGCRIFPGNLDDYLWKIDQEQATRAAPSGSGTRETAPENPRERRRRLAHQNAEIAPLRKALESLEESITNLEEKIASREAEMTDKAFFENGDKTARAVREYESWKRQLTCAMEEWELAGAKLEAMQKTLDC